MPDAKTWVTAANVVCALVMDVFSCSSNKSYALPSAELADVAGIKVSVNGFKVPITTAEPNACPVTVIAVAMFEAEMTEDCALVKLLKNIAGVDPVACPTTSSVRGVMLATTVPASLPTATEWRMVKPSTDVALSTHGKAAFWRMPE